jgi:hypothetical protein
MKTVREVKCAVPLKSDDNITTGPLAVKTFVGRGCEDLRGQDPEQNRHKDLREMRKHQAGENYTTSFVICNKY